MMLRWGEEEATNSCGALDAYSHIPGKRFRGYQGAMAPVYCCLFLGGRVEDHEIFDSSVPLGAGRQCFFLQSFSWDRM